MGLGLIICGVFGIAAVYSCVVGLSKLNNSEMREEELADKFDINNCIFSLIMLIGAICGFFIEYL